jgi:hypothetical protein
LSYFKDITQVEVTTLFQFQTPAVGVQNAVLCKGGETAVWEYLRTDDDGNHLIKIYDMTTGEAVYKATVYALPGRDVFCGLFSTGAIPSGDIFAVDTVYYRIDYI